MMHDPMNVKRQKSELLDSRFGCFILRGRIPSTYCSERWVHPRWCDEDKLFLLPEIECPSVQMQNESSTLALVLNSY